MSDGPVQVYSAANSIEAALVLQLLTDAGIRGRVASNSMEVVSGSVPFQLISVPIWVHQSQFEEAQKVIREHQAGLSTDEETP